MTGAVYPRSFDDRTPNGGLAPNDGRAYPRVSARAAEGNGGLVKVRKAVIPAAGIGTRFLPATKAQPKVMLPVIDVPAIQLVVEEAVRAGLEDIVIVIGRNQSSIE